MNMLSEDIALVALRKVRHAILGIECKATMRLSYAGPQVSQMKAGKLFVRLKDWILYKKRILSGRCRWSLRNTVQNLVEI